MSEINVKFLLKNSGKSTLGLDKLAKRWRLYLNTIGVILFVANCFL
jgi:hypothetical protein